MATQAPYSSRHMGFRVRFQFQMQTNSTSSRLCLSSIRYARPCQYEGKLQAEINQFLSIPKAGPLRLERSTYRHRKNGSQVEVLYLRERSWPEYFCEKLFASAGKIASIEADVQREIKGAFSPLIQGIERDTTGTAIQSPYNEVLFLKQCKDELLSFASEKKETQPDGFLDLKAGLSVSDCSPLDGACNFAIVNDTLYGSKTDGKIRAWKSTKQAFDTIWKARRNRPVPTYSNEGSEVNIRFRTHRLHAVDDKLSHIQQLRYVPDNPLQRSSVGLSPSCSREIWKSFYLKCLEGLHGGVVLQAYPDRWKRDANGDFIPIYSKENLRGMVDAGVEVTDAIQAQLHGRLPMSVMFAVQDRNMRTFLTTEILTRRKGVTLMEDEPTDFPSDQHSACDMQEPEMESNSDDWDWVLSDPVIGA